MKSLLLSIYFLFLAALISYAQQLTIKSDSLKLILKGSSMEEYEWIYCNSLNKLFTADTLILYSTLKNTAFFLGCQSDSISILDFGNGRTLFSEKSRSERKLSINFSIINTFKTTIKKKRHTVFITFKNHRASYWYKLADFKQEYDGNKKRCVLRLIRNKNYTQQTSLLQPCNANDAIPCCTEPVFK